MTQPAADADAFQVFREPLRITLSFAWQEDRLQLDPEQWNEWQNRTAQPLPSVDEMTEDIFVNQERRLLCPPAISLFHEEIIGKIEARRLQLLNDSRNKLIGRDGIETDISAGGAHTGSSRWANSGTFEVWLRKPRLCDARISMDEREFLFSLAENVGRCRSLTVRDDTTEGLRIACIGKSFLSIEQSPDGSVRVIQSEDGKLIDLKEDSFASIYEKHADYVNEMLLPRTEEYGIILPAGRSVN